MGALTASLFITLDGVYQAPGDPSEDNEGGFRLGGWQQPFFDEATGKALMGSIAKMDSMLLGRKTYDIFASYWPHAPANDPIAKIFNRIPKYVVSHTLKKADWTNTTILSGDLPREVARIKANHKFLSSIGSGQLVRSLLDIGLVDRLDLMIYPLVAGQGKRLFSTDSVPTAFKLVSCESFERGAVRAVYQPTGKPKVGSMAQSTMSPK